MTTKRPSLAEVYEDAIDWMQRWQAGRKRNTDLARQGKENAAQIILDAQKMNRELDHILRDYEKARQQEVRSGQMGR